MTKLSAFAMSMFAFASSASAQAFNYDGSWAETSKICSATNTDIVPMRISGTTIHFYESNCELTDPVSIRGMNGHLVDFLCSGEGETWSLRGLLLLNIDGTLTLSFDERTSVLERCE